MTQIYGMLGRHVYVNDADLVADVEAAWKYLETAGVSEAERKALPLPDYVSLMDAAIREMRWL